MDSREPTSAMPMANALSRAYRFGRDLTDAAGGHAGLRDAMGDRVDSRRAPFVMQMSMLCARHARQVVRHPMLLWVQLGCTAGISLLAGIVFWQLNYDLDSGVLTRVD